MDELVETLDAMVPEAVREVCQTLTDAGFEAYAVGGAVRDAILGQVPGDWDVATSAHPDEVMALFGRTIPTGLAHGTVTVLIDHYPIEVTTFRGEGVYSDARRPDSVTFGVPLEEDLARRDLIINAMAYDPIAKRIADPFGGREDLANRRVRAVGNAVDRFTEDGLRVMRAIRFAAVLEFELDEDTEAGIGPALVSLAKVSQERVRDELMKLLEARVPSRGLEIARRTGVIELVLPEATRDDEGWARVMSCVDAAGAGLFRLALLLMDTSGGRAAVDAVARRLKLSNDERAAVVQLADGARRRPNERWPEPELRRYLGTIGRARGHELIALWDVLDRVVGSSGAQVRAREAAQAILDRGDALTVGDLAITGAEVMTALDIGPSRDIGVILRALHDRVMDDPTLNDPERLRALAVEIHASMAD